MGRFSNIPTVNAGRRSPCAAADSALKQTRVNSPTGFGSQASLFEIAFEGLALAA